jgi:hypothetical protein
MLEVFETKPYVSIPTPYSLQSAIRGGLECWQKFCALEDDFKDRLRLDKFNTPHHDPGYRNKKAAAGDKKELFHYTFGQKQFMWVDGILKLAYAQPTAVEFFSAADQILELATKTIVNNTSLFGFSQKEMRDMCQFSTLRFLRYVVQKPGMEIADPHFDFCGLTFHLFPNNGELEYLYRGEWYKFDPPKDRAPVFPSFQSFYASEKKVEPVIHRAVQRQIGERLAVVVFIPFTFCGRFPKPEDQREWAAKNHKRHWFEEKILEQQVAMIA